MIKKGDNMKNRSTKNRIYRHKLDNKYDGCLVIYMTRCQNDDDYVIVRDMIEPTHNYKVKKSNLYNEQGELFDEDYYVK